MMHRSPAVAAAGTLMVVLPSTGAVASGTRAPSSVVRAAVSAPAGVGAASGRDAGAARTAGGGGTVTVLADTRPGRPAASEVAARMRALGGRVVVRWPQIGVVVAAVPESRASEFTRRLRREAGVRSAGVSGRVLTPRPTAPRSPAAPVRGPETVEPDVAAVRPIPAGRYATGAGVGVGVADDGLFDEHAEFAGRVDTARSGSCLGGVYRAGKGAWRPAAGGHDVHGTGVASVIAAAADGYGVRGVAPQARLVAMRVVDDEGNIYPEASICAAMTGATLGLPVVNHSYGIDWVRPLRHAYFDPQDADQAAVIDAVGKAFSYSRAHGVLSVAAAGNAGEDAADKPGIPPARSEEHLGPIPARMRGLPGELPGVLAVSESDPDGPIAFASTVGLGVVDLTSVGVGRMAATPGAYQENAGTSFAAPAVTGVAALVRQLRPRATPAQIESILFSTARPKACAGEISSGQPCRARDGVTSFFGHGQVDALAAVRAAR